MKIKFIFPHIRFIMYNMNRRRNFLISYIILQKRKSIEILKRLDIPVINDDK